MMYWIQYPCSMTDWGSCRKDCLPHDDFIVNHQGGVAQYWLTRCRCNTSKLPKFFNLWFYYLYNTIYNHRNNKPSCLPWKYTTKSFYSQNKFSHKSTMSSKPADIRTAELHEPVDIAEYLFTRLKQIGCGSVHGVPGDFNLVALDYVPKVGLKWAGNCNELNAGASWVAAPLHCTGTNWFFCSICSWWICPCQGNRCNCHDIRCWRALSSEWNSWIVLGTSSSGAYRRYPFDNLPEKRDAPASYPR